jgi:hypothetical protein
MRANLYPFSYLRHGHKKYKYNMASRITNASLTLSVVEVKWANSLLQHETNALRACMYECPKRLVARDKSGHGPKSPCCFPLRSPKRTVGHPKLHVYKRISQYLSQLPSFFFLFDFLFILLLVITIFIRDAGFWPVTMLE